MRSVIYQPILHTLYYTLHTEHAYCHSYRYLNNVDITTVIEMVEMVEILDGRLGQRSVERVRYVINNLLHLVTVKYGDISLVLSISTRLRLVTILSLLVKYLVIFHADPCNKSYISREISIEHPSVGLASLAQLHGSAWNMTRYFTSSDSIVTSRRRVEIQSTSEMSPYFTMTKCNKLFITYLTRSTERLPSLPSSI